MRTLGKVTRVQAVVMDNLSTRLMRRAAIAGAVCGVMLVAVYVLAVWTPAGQRFEDTVLAGASLATDGEEQSLATWVLKLVSTPTLALAASVVFAIGLARRRPSLGILGVGVIAASVVTAEIVRRSASRPVLLLHGTRREDQSFPSGHTATAMSAMFALILVVPQRFRVYTLIVAAPWAIGTGVATVAAGWHRPSDTTGSEIIALFYACVAIAVLARRCSVREATPRATRGRVLRGVVVGLYLGGVAITVGLMVATARARVDASPDYAFAAGCTIVLVLGVAATLVLLWLLRGMELTGGADPSAPSGISGAQSSTRVASDAPPNQPSVTPT